MFEGISFMNVAEHTAEVPVSFTRRSLLLAAPVVSTFAALPVAYSATAATSAALLLPDSERIVGSRAQWYDGFLREQRELGSSVPVIQTSYATGPGAMRIAVQRLLDTGCTTLVGWADANSVADLAPALERYGARFVVSDLGAKAMHGELPASVARCGADLWRRAHSAGSYLANQGARTALVASSFYESGFDLVSAFDQGFRAGGGERVEIVVAGTPQGDTCDLAWDRIDREHPGFQPDVVFALYSGAEAQAFFRLIGDLHAPTRLRNRPVMVLSSALEGLRSQTSLALTGRPLLAMHARWAGAPLADSLHMLAGRAAARLAVSNERVHWYGAVSEGSLADVMQSAAESTESLTAATCGDCLFPGRTPAGWLMPYGA